MFSSALKHSLFNKVICLLLPFFLHRIFDSRSFLSEEKQRWFRWGSIFFFLTIVIICFFIRVYMQMKRKLSHMSLNITHSLSFGNAGSMFIYWIFLLSTQSSSLCLHCMTFPAGDWPEFCPLRLPLWGSMVTVQQEPHNSLKKTQGDILEVFGNAGETCSEHI